MTLVSTTSTTLSERLDQSLEEEDVIPPPLDYKRLTYQIGEHIETIDLEEEESESVREAFEDILTSIKEHRMREAERNETAAVIQRKDLMSRLSNVSNSNKKDLWSQIKELTGWTNSKSELDDGDFKYKIVY
jgi:predicted site-specific integrase-resolvase